MLTDKKINNLLGFIFQLNEALPANRFCLNVNCLQIIQWPFMQHFPDSSWKCDSELFQQLFFYFEERLVNQVEHLSIDSRYCKIKNILAKDIAHFCNNIPNLQSIYLNLRYNQVTNQSGEILSTIFINRKCLGTVHLDLENNLIGDKGLKLVLKNIGNLPYLLDLNLNLRQNELSTKSAQRISQILSKQQNLESLLVNVEQNNITDDGIYGIIHSISYLNQLKTLSLTLGCNPYQHLERLKSLRSFYLPYLQTFEFSLFNSASDNISVKLIHNLIKSSLFLENLYVDLRMNTLTDQSLLFFAQSISKFQYIMNLRLNFNSNVISEFSIVQLVDVCFGFNLLSEAKILHTNFQQNVNNINFRHNRDCVCNKLERKVQENKTTILSLYVYEKQLKPSLISYSPNMNLLFNFWDLIF